jgi:hypothetical protein
MNQSNDPAGTEIPDISTYIPADADPDTKQFMRAQMVMQAAFHAFGNRQAGTNVATIPIAEVIDVMCVALAMTTAINPGVQTPRDVREELDAQAKFTKRHVLALRNGGEETLKAIADALSMTFSHGAA